MSTKDQMAEPKIPARLSYRVEAAAEALDIGRSLVFALIRAGCLRAVKIGRRTVIPVAEVEAFLARGGTSNWTTPTIGGLHDHAR